MQLSNSIKFYNIYDECGCQDDGTMEEWAEQIKTWLVEYFGEYIDVEVVDTTVSNNQIMYIHIFFKNTRAGVYFSITKTDVNLSTYNNVTGVGCVYGTGTRVAADTGTSYRFHNKNLKLLVIKNDKLCAFIPTLTIGGTKISCVGYLNGNTTAGFVLCSSTMYVSYGSDYAIISNGVSTKSNISQKLLIPFAAPQGDFFGNKIFKSDGLIMGNFSIYSLNNRYFLDIYANNEYQCFTIELLDEEE